MADEETEFNDPVLKQAVKKAWGAEQCPLALRNKVCPVERLGGSMRRMLVPWHSWSAFTAAAVVLIAVSIPFFHRLNPPGPIALPPVTVALIPPTLQTDLVRTHDRCCQHEDHHHLNASRDDDAAIAKAFHTILSQAVLVARPTESGWTFRGAAVCHVGSARTAHLVFAKGSDFISIFSLPASSDVALKDGDQAQVSTDGHAIAAFAKDGSIFCLVGSGPDPLVNVDHISQMRDRMESQVLAGAAEPERTTAIAELLYPNVP